MKGYAMKFDEFWEELISYAGSMPKPSLMANGNCAYRGVDGQACLVGHFLDDDTARKLDGGDSTVWTRILAERYPDTIPDWMRGRSAALGEVQWVHDRMSQYVVGEDADAGFGATLVANLQSNKMRIQDIWNAAGT